MLPIVRYRGDGLLASVDGLRFVVPVCTISAAPSPKYFGFKRGITWLNAVNDQVAGIGQMVVPGTPRDSLHILHALLNLDGGVKPEMVATRDTLRISQRHARTNDQGEATVAQKGLSTPSGSADASSANSSKSMFAIDRFAWTSWTAVGAVRNSRGGGESMSSW